MTTLTIENVIELGGNEWNKGEMKRVYITQELFNKITGFGYSLNAEKWKFYVDSATGDIFRTNGKNLFVKLIFQNLTHNGLARLHSRQL